jgi:antitoxin (DNA-binding transcriptional repressor) of toxin-antitoxin stability system
VSSRDLSRHTSRLLDEIEAAGSALVVIRYGRPTAVLVPFEDVAARPQLPRISELGGEITLWPIPEDELDDVELSEHQRAILVGVARCTLLYWTPSQIDMQVRDRAVALGKLEVAGLLQRGPGASWELTRKGELIAARLDSEA